jgi:hypothetical protein
MRLPGKARRVTTPDGVEWRVARQWPTNRKIHSWGWYVDIGTNSRFLGSDAFNGVDDLGGAVLALVGIAVAALVILPLLLFGLELVIIGCLLAAGLIGQTLLRRPWTVKADIIDRPGHGAQWSVIGWRRSQRLMDEVVAALAAHGAVPAAESPWGSAQSGGQPQTPAGGSPGPGR